MKACKIVCGAALLCASAYAFSQTNASQGSAGVSMPAVTAPSMPTVSVPTIGGGFYTPSSPTIKNNASAKTTKTAPASQGNATTTTPSSAQATASRIAAAQSATAAGLTASDLTSLDSLGLLSSGVLGGGNLTSLAAKNASLSGSTDSLLLQQILAQLTELKEQVAKQNAPAPDAQTTAAQTVSAVTEHYTQETKSGHKILRFVANGYDILATCRDIYFSTQETDGSFLLTGDRKYLSSGANRSETFHLLFRATGSTEGITNYAVTPAVTQDYTNEYSFLYQLAERKNLTAQQTGNFISLRVNEPNWKLDLLLSLDD